MSSWFSSETFKGLAENVQKSVESVKESIPENLGAMTIDNEMLSKLTLTSPELAAERARIDKEEKRKEEMKNRLAGMLPWETRDPDRDILVEECKDAILNLSSERDTFYGPFPMPKKRVKLEEKKDGDENEADDEEEEDDGDQDGGFESIPDGSEARIEKLLPLPALLDDFDLDCHVGLIEKVLKQDPNLVEMQSSLSGGGERELAFWKNYFFNCAFTRYEAGLSVDELWSDQPPPTDPETAAAASENDNEDTITFEDAENEKVTEPPPKAFATDPQTDIEPTTDNEKETETAEGGSSQGADFELVDDSENLDLGEPADYELDELEAEIAKELEDL